MPSPRAWVPGPDRLRRLRTLWREARPFLGASTGQLLLLAAGSVLAGIVEAAVLALVALLAAALAVGAPDVDVTLGPLAFSAPVRTVVAVGLGLTLVRGVLHIWLAHRPAVYSAAVMGDLRRTLFDRFMGTAWPVQAAERDGYFQTLMSTHASYASMLILRLSAAITAVLMFTTLLASAFVINVWAALVLVSASALLFLVLMPLSRRLRKQAKLLSEENVDYASGVQEIVAMAEEIQVFGASPAYQEQLNRLIRGVRRPMQQTRFLLRAVPSLYQSVALLLLVVALGLIHVSGSTAVPELGAVVLLLVRSLNFGQNMQAAIAGLNELVPYVDELRRAFDRYAASPQPDGSRSLARVEQLGMSDVHYAYRAGEEVLGGVNFTVHRGEAIGIVGPSGAGKSTLTQLMLRLRSPTRGTVQVNGEDAASFRRADWLRRVSYVPQSPQLISGTVADNIRFHRPDITDEQVEEAARRAHIHDEILSWPQGYLTIVGQRASAVSGGQRQRLCLARALAGSPDVLVLDEPTSALDVRSEEAVQQSLEELKKDLLLFLVAHRMSTLSVCDRVMVIAEGRLQAMADPGTLLQENDFYREVIRITRRQSAT